MDLEEIKERYKILPMWVRITLAILIGCTPAAFTFWEDGERLAEEVASAETIRDVARTKFERARAKKAELPKLEEKLLFTQGELERAKAQLPDYYLIEEILQKVATVARETKVELTSFTPQAEVGGGGDYRYMTMPVALNVDGLYRDVALFLDRVAQFDKPIFLKEINLTSKTEAMEANNGNQVAPVGTRRHKEQIREAMRVAANLKLSVYRAMTDEESALQFGAGGTEPNAQKRQPGQAPAGSTDPNNKNSNVDIYGGL